MGAASRQLDTAIRLLFTAGDLVAVHTLAGAASVITSDLVEAFNPEQSWDKVAQQIANLSQSDYYEIMRRTQNFLNHARRDVEREHEFASSDTECLIFWGVLNLAELTLLTNEQSVYQLWFLAAHIDILDSSSDIHRAAFCLFGDLRNETRDNRLAAGLKQISI